MLLSISTLNINTQSRLQFHGVVVIPHCDLPEPAFNQLFIKLGQFTPLLSNEVLQFLDTFHLDGLGGFIGIRLLLKLSQVENAVLVQNIAVGDDIAVAIWECMGYTVLLCYTLFKTGSLAKSLFRAH